MLSDIQRVIQMFSEQVYNSQNLPDLNLAKLTLIVMVLATLLYHYLKVLLEARFHVLCSVSVSTGRMTVIAVFLSVGWFQADFCTNI